MQEEYTTYIRSASGRVDIEIPCGSQEAMDAINGIMDELVRLANLAEDTMGQIEKKVAAAVLAAMDGE